MKKYLLDTHTFLWWIADDESLSESVRSRIADPESTIHFSVVSGWEISIKQTIGRLKLSKPPKQFVQQQLSETGFSILDIRLDHALEVSTLPLIHNDPFDRLLVAQCVCDGMTLLSRDALLTRYSIEVVW